jgi:hypothetical protein
MPWRLGGSVALAHHHGYRGPACDVTENWPQTPGLSWERNGRFFLTTRLLEACTENMWKSFKYRLCPNKQQQRLLHAQLEECRWLYNHLLAARKSAWKERQESLRLYDQQVTLPMLKVAWPTLAEVQSQVLQNVAARIDLAPSRRSSAAFVLARTPATHVFAVKGAMIASPILKFRLVASWMWRWRISVCMGLDR